MCGISAIFLTEPISELPVLINKSLDLIAHRGPDGRGTVIGQGGALAQDSFKGKSDWALGHVRLSILDTSSAGNQPMASADNTCWITYNGEIYNYVELKRELEDSGFLFKTGTDTEVIINAYKKWGIDCVSRFAGMFAFVLVDLVKGMVFLGRDRLGIKPLYTWSNGKKIAVVSEPKQLFAFQDFRPKADRQQVVDYLLDDVVGHEPEKCFFSQVTPLEPGHVMSWKLGDVPSSLQTQSYWSPEFSEQKISWNNAVEDTGTLFRTILDQHLRSDVPVGSCLSGGMDSSSIVSMVSREFKRPVHTFSSCFPGFEFDEQEYMDAVTEHGRSFSNKVYPDDDQLSKDLDQLIYMQDEPFTSLSLYAQWCVMKAAKQSGIPVLLDGQGGDESLCGYRKYAFFYLKKLIRDRKFIGAYRHLFDLITKGDQRIFDFKAGQRYLPAFLRKRHDRVYDLLSPEWRQFSRSAWQEKMGDVSSMKQHQVADLRLWSLPALLRYEDRNSMAHSIEARVPFVDHRFVEHCLAMPSEFFFRKGMTKRLLSEALGTTLPDSIHKRRTKFGFETPQSIWMKGNLGTQLLSSIGKSPRLAEILNISEVANAFKGFQNNRSGFSDASLFRCACLGLWLERFSVEF